MRSSSVLVALFLAGAPLGAVHAKGAGKAPAPADAAQAEAARGDAWTVAGRCDEALAAYDRALAKSPGDGMVQVHRAHCLDVLGKRDEARQLLDSLAARPEPVGSAALAERGDRALATGDLDGAVAAYDRLVTKQPASAEAKLALLEALRAQVEKGVAGAKPRALELVERLKRDPRADQTMRARAEEVGALVQYGAAAADLVEAKAQLALGNARAAVPHLERAAQVAPECEEAQYLLGVAYATPEVGKKAEARKAWGRAAHVKEAQLALGVDAFEGGDLDEAKRRLAGATDLDGRYQAAWYQLGLVEREAGRNDAARKAFQQAAQVDPRSELGRWAQTKLSILTGQVQALAEGQVIDPGSEIGIGQELVKQVEGKFGKLDDPATEERLGRILGKLASVSDRPAGEMRTKVVLIDVPIVNALTLPGGTVLVFRGLIDLVKQKLGDTDDAWAAVLGHECAHAALRHGMGMIQVASSLVSGGRALNGMGDLAGLLNTVSRAHEFEADQFGTLYAYRAGYNPGAMLSLQQAMLEKNGEIPRGMTHPQHQERIARVRDYLLDVRAKVRGFDLAVKSLGSGDYDAAAQRFEVFLGVYPESIAARSNLGVAMHRKALTALDPATRFRRATDVDPNSRARKIELRAGAENVAGLKAAPKIDERLLKAAAAEYQAALKLDPTYVKALTNLGAALDDLHDKKGARTTLERAVRMAPTSKEAWNNLGAIAAEMGDTARALEALQKAVGLDAQYPEAIFNLALVYEQAGKPKDAAQTWERYVAVDAKSGWAEVAQKARARLPR